VRSRLLLLGGLAVAGLTLAPDVGANDLRTFHRLYAAAEYRRAVEVGERLLADGATEVEATAIRALLAACLVDEARLARRAARLEAELLAGYYRDLLAGHGRDEIRSRVTLHLALCDLVRGGAEAGRGAALCRRRRDLPRDPPVEEVGRRVRQGEQRGQAHVRARIGEHLRIEDRLTGQRIVRKDHQGVSPDGR